MVKERLDKVLVARGLTRSREKAKALIMAGSVLVDGVPATKAGTMVQSDAEFSIKDAMPYVSRGGVKIKGAIDHFGVELGGKIAMDVGASTGGFTDCMLKEGAKKVYAVDVGYGQFDWTLRNDPRVVLIERTNIRYFDREKIADEIDIAAIDVSFISLKLVLPNVVEFVRAGGEVLALVKPQFEVGKGNVGKGGVVRDEKKRIEAVRSVAEFSEGIGLTVIGTLRSPLMGPKGNVEHFIYLKRG